VSKQKGDSVKLHKKSWQERVVRAIFGQINASPDDIRKAAVADARRTLESAAHFTRGGCAPAPDHDADYTSRARRVEAEQRRLIQWAKENGKLGFSSRLPPVFAQGGEHDVFFQKRTRRYLKATRQDRHKGYGIALGSHTHGATPSEYLDRLILQNWTQSAVAVRVAKQKKARRIQNNKSGPLCSRRLRAAHTGPFSFSHFALGTLNPLLKNFGDFHLVFQNIFKPFINLPHVLGRELSNGRLDFLHVAHRFNFNPNRAKDKPALIEQAEKWR
jgi:hypothetical protein